MLHTFVFLGAVVEGRHGLKALTDAESYTHDQRREAVDHTHGGDRGVAVGLCQIVEQTAGDRGQALTDQRGKSDLADADIVGETSADRADRHGALCGSQIHNKQNQKADHLRDGGGKSRTEHAHIKNADQEPVAKNVQDAARGKTHHGVKCLSLVAQVVIQNQRGNHKGAGDQHPHTVVAGVGKDRLGTAEKAHEWLKKDQTEYR